MSRPAVRLVLVLGAMAIAACAGSPTAPPAQQPRASVKAPRRDGNLPPCDSTNRLSDVGTSCFGGYIPPY